MNFSEQFIQIMDKVGEKIGISIDWTSQNIIPYLEDLLSRFIKYETLTSIVWIVVAMIPIIIALALCLYLKRNWDDLSYDVESFLIIIFTIVAIIAGIIFIPIQVFDIIEVNTIPEKTIIEYIQFQLK